MQQQPTFPNLYHLQPRSARLVNLVLVAAMIGFAGLMFYPYLPAATYKIEQPRLIAQTPAVLAAAEQSREGRWLIIPAIGVDTPIVEGADIGILDRAEGVWHQVGEAGHGNFVLAGHRFKYLPPNTTTLYNLDKVREGEKIIVWWDGQKRSYQVVERSTVKRDKIEILNPTTDQRLTIYTCKDVAITERYVLVARPVAD